jgi:hypothetical protein
MGNVSPLPQQGAVFFDPRDDQRFLRVSYHAEQGLFVMSWWRDAMCLGTFHLDPSEAPRVIHTIAAGLADAAGSSASGARADSSTA